MFYLEDALNKYTLVREVDAEKDFDKLVPGTY